MGGWEKLNKSFVLKKKNYHNWNGLGINYWDLSQAVEPFRARQVSLTPI